MSINYQQYLKTSVIQGLTTRHWRLALLLAGLAGSVPAMALDYDLYGQMHISVDYLDAKDTVGSAAGNVSSNSSILGFRGKQAIDEQLSVGWQLESTVDVVNTGWVMDRDSFLSLTGNWGTLRSGQFDTPMKILRNRTDFFSNQLGDARNIVHTAHLPLDRRLKNSVAYQTPVMGGGFIGNIQYSANTAAGGSQDTDNAALSASLEYKADSFWLAIAHDDTRKNTGDQNATRVAAYYDWPRVRVSVLYQDMEDAVLDSSAFGGGVRAKLTNKVALKGQYYQYEADDAADSGAHLIAAGTDYNYSSNLRFYLNYAVLKNDNTQLTPFSVARSSKPDTVLGDQNPSGISVGTIFSF